MWEVREVLGNLQSGYNKILCYKEKLIKASTIITGGIWFKKVQLCQALLIVKNKSKSTSVKLCEYNQEYLLTLRQ